MTLNEIRPQHLRETRKQGSATFPCTFYTADYRSESSPFYTKLHWHDAVEILHFEKGHFELSVNMNKINTEDECYAFVEGGMLHSIWCESGFIEQAFLLEPEFLEIAAVDESEREVLAPLSHGTLHFPVLVRKNNPAFPEINIQFGRIRKIFENNGEIHGDQRFVNTPSDQLRIRASMMLMLASLWDAGLLSSGRRPEDSRAEAMKKVIAYIREHYNSKIYVADLAGIMNMNEQYFCRFFKNATGKSVVQYINEFRIGQAGILLGHSQLSVTEIALECGFGNIGHFINEFKKINGMTPHEYRKKVREISL